MSAVFSGNPTLIPRYFKVIPLEFLKNRIRSLIAIMSTSLLNSVLSIANLFSVVNVFKIFSKITQLLPLLNAYHLRG